MVPKPPIDAIIFDLGDVLFQWSPNTNTGITPKLLRSILSSTVCSDYECGRLSRESCYNLVAQEFALDSAQVANAFSEALQSLRPDDSVVSFLQKLREDGVTRVYAMSNIGREDFAAVEEKMDWGVFDGVFISGETGMRKPDPRFFQYVLEEIHIPPERIVFVDDKTENVLAAEALGVRGILFDDSTVRHLEEYREDPIWRGLAYLRKHARCLNSITNTEFPVYDNFAQLLLLEATQEPSVLQQTNWWSIS